MAVVRIPEWVWRQADAHLGARPERFGFFLADTAMTSEGPIFLVRDFHPVADENVVHGRGGYEVDIDDQLAVVNRAVREKQALIEAHSHGGQFPRFSTHVDRPGLEEFAPYVLESLPSQPYAALVWGDDTAYGEFFTQDGARGIVRSILVIGEQLRQIVSRDDDLAPIAKRFDRQGAWFTAEGQRMLRRLRVGVVGAGGTGSHVCQQLAYLGCRDFVVVEFDPLDETNTNRVVTGTPADLGTNKGILARRAILQIATDATVRLMEEQLQTPTAFDALKSVDMLIGCVDNDGARLVLNELALAYEIPYFDIASAIHVSNGGPIESIGARFVAVVGDGPCLHCVDEIDTEEARFYLATPDQRAIARARGYAPNVKAPAVVSLNGLIASVLVNEFAMWCSGLRPLNRFMELELLDLVRQPGQWLTPRSGADRRPDCIECTYRGVRDGLALERYSSS